MSFRISRYACELGHFTRMRRKSKSITLSPRYIWASMRWLEISFVLMASLGLAGCADRLQSQQLPAKWSTGFWIWDPNPSGPPLISEKLDVLFVHAGTITKDPPRSGRWSAYGTLPKHLPVAREYWLVYRFERQGVPDAGVVPSVAEAFAKIQEEAQGRSLHVPGIQLDIDSPTGSLPEYVSFLRELRKQLPPGTQISITALLDWFREGTAIASVVKEVDEFVPQFYDLNNPNIYSGGDAIAAKFDGSKWGPAFNRFGKRFRIGISTFGRARLVPKEQPAPSQYGSVYSLADMTPLDIALNSAFRLRASHNGAGELLLNYEASRKTQFSYNHLEPGDSIQFILPTPDVVRTATESARRMGGSCAGVVFFRWPTSTETLALQPDNVLSAAGILKSQEKPASIRLVDGDCAAVRCVDVYLLNTPPLAPKSVRYRIRATKELEYFLPEERMPVKMTGPAELEFSLPPYGGRGRMYLGRAISTTAAEFTVEQEP
jgi:hypothetical protein